MTTRAPARPVVVTSRSFSSGTLDLVRQLEAAGLKVVRAATDHDLDALREPLAEAVAWVAGTAPVTAAHLGLAPHLRVVARHGVGVDAVDLAAARTANITVANTPGANSEAVAEHTIGLLLAALRGIPAGDTRVRAGVWDVTRGRQLAGSTAGVIGFGRIGREVAKRLLALGCPVLVHDPHLPVEAIRAAGCEPVDLTAVRDRADVVSLHVPGGNVVIDASWVTHAKAAQTIVNTARGDLVDEDAVAASLRAGRLYAYAADTLAHEDGAYRSPLLAPDLADHVVVTPHLGAQTVEAVDRMGAMAVEAILDVLADRQPQHLVEPPDGEPR